MDVHTSTREPEPVYVPNFKPKYWGETLSYLRYGLGNFYSLNGHITHYHNWFDRVGLGSEQFDPASKETVPPEGVLGRAAGHRSGNNALFLWDPSFAATRLKNFVTISGVGVYDLTTALICSFLALDST